MQKIKIQDLLNFRFPSAPAFSPDGKLAAFVVQTPSLEKNHSLSRIGKPANRLRRMEEILAWMDKYLKPRENT